MKQKADNTKQIHMHIAPERQAPRNLNFEQFSKWFCQELKKDNFEIPFDNHSAVYDAAFQKYKAVQKQQPSGPMPQAFQIAAIIKNQKEINILVCSECEKLIIGISFNTDEKDFVYCEKCAEKHLAECRSCHTIYRKSSMKKLKDNTFRCRTCSRNLKKAINLIKKCQSVFSHNNQSQQ